MLYCDMFDKTGALLCRKNAVRTETPEGFTLRLPREEIPEGTSYVNFCPELFSAPAQAGGYMVIPNGGSDAGFLLSEMHPRTDTEYVGEPGGVLLPVMGFSADGACTLAVVTDMPWDFSIVAGVKEKVYYLYPRFAITELLEEDPEVKCYSLPVGSTYSDMARVYRAWKLSTGCIPLRERVKTRPELDYAARGPEIRIRMAWKPVPSPVAYQTPETEPEVHVACTFEKAERICDALKENGVEKAEICLVGWNIGGHDGRWMQYFPVEEKLGGEAALRRLIAHAQKLGYQIVGHANVDDSYTIAEMWTEDDMIRLEDGSMLTTPFYWGGGKPHKVCPSRFMKTATREFPKMADLGFRGLHYVDVLTILPPWKCWSKAHPVTSRQSIGYVREIMQYSRQKFGGFASEGGLDHSVEDLDFALYTGGNLLREQPEICDRPIPFWELVYHGIVLYNPSSETVNYPVKDRNTQLKLLEYGGRPVAYLHSRFVSPGSRNWMGEDDLTCGSEEEIAHTAQVIGDMYREYAERCDLQLEFMENHEETAPGVFETTYSDGTVTVADYNTGRWEVRRPEKEKPC